LGKAAAGDADAFGTYPAATTDGDAEAFATWYAGAAARGGAGTGTGEEA